MYVDSEDMFLITAGIGAAIWLVRDAYRQRREKAEKRSAQTLEEPEVRLYMQEIFNGAKSLARKGDFVREGFGDEEYALSGDGWRIEYSRTGKSELVYMTTRAGNIILERETTGTRVSHVAEPCHASFQDLKRELYRIEESFVGARSDSLLSAESSQIL